MAGSEQVRIVLTVSREWPSFDLARWQEVANPDVTYINTPWPDLTVHGVEAWALFMTKMGRGFDLSMDVASVAEAGDTVFLERVEHMTPRDGSGSTHSTPCVTVAKFENGKLAEWRDYFDGVPLQSLYESLRRARNNDLG